MNFKVKLDLHSVNPVGDEVITWDLCYERFIHAEFMTHRWARNASSSRAIPYLKMKKWIKDDPAMPLHLGTNRSGMQAGAECSNPDDARGRIHDLLGIVYNECDELVDKDDLHKEIVNRYAEPWGWINVVASMGRPQLMNFFKLRISPYAHPNIQRLAVQMARAYRASVPQTLEVGEWHLPFTRDLAYDVPLADKIKWSVARSAWTSYRTADGKEATYQDAARRHDDCVKLLHVTPLEHQYEARADHGRNGGCVGGYNQYRAMIPNESADDFDFSILDTQYAGVDFLVK